jgi:putative sterol carrier protein
MVAESSVQRRLANELTFSTIAPSLDQVATMYDFLAKSFNPEHGTGLDACIGFDWGSGSIAFAIREQQLDLDCNCEPEMTIYFESQKLAEDIISGSADAIDAFMRGRFRASGHLIWVFHTMAAFRNSRP